MSEEQILSSRVLLICEATQTAEKIEAFLEKTSNFILAASSTTGGNITDLIDQSQPDILLWNFTEDSLVKIDELSLNFPKLAIIMILGAKDTQFAPQVMMAGARAFLQEPFTEPDIEKIMVRIQQLQARLAPVIPDTPPTQFLEPQKSSTVTVFSPRGGAGTTTIAINLALALRKQSKQDVLLIDGKLMFGHVDLMLNIKSQNSIYDLITHVNNLDERIIQDVISDHVSGVHVLSSPPSIPMAQSIEADDLYKVVLSLQNKYPLLVIDGGNALTENSVTFMDTSLKIILLITPDLASIRDAQRFFEISRTLNYGPDKVLIVLNKSGLKGGIRKNEIESALQKKIFKEIPYTGPDPLRALNGGVPLMQKQPRNPASKAIMKLSKEIYAIYKASSEKQARSQTMPNETS